MWLLCDQATGVEYFSSEGKNCFALAESAQCIRAIPTTQTDRLSDTNTP